MVDAIVSTVIKQLATIIQQEIEQEVRLVVGVEKDVEKLTLTFSKIRAVLKDAEKKQIIDDSVGLWLQDLKDVAYDIDDVLDEWRTAILKSQSELQAVHHDEHGARSISPKTKKVCYPFCNLFSFKKHRIGLRHDIGHRIKDINERVDQIASDQSKFGFIGNYQTSRNYEMMDDESSRRRRILETSSLVDVKEVFGRDMDRDTIISKLLSEGSQREVVVSGVSVISIVGMPGLGKTTLAQIVFNDDRVKNHFIERMWIHVSKPFDRVKVALNIITEMGGNMNDTTQGVSGHDIAWQTVHRQLIKSIKGKQFLLVLDDVWNEDPMLWDPLRISLQSDSQAGSRILVTTRNENVARMMGTTYVHKLKILSNEDCWSMLSHYAFFGRQQEEECGKLKEIGKELANKCHGLPLSAKTLGSLLRLKESKQDWQCVLESDVWRVVATVDKPILPALMLSYNDLPSPLKQCFAYCSLLPRGRIISKGRMVMEWMAQGFLSDSLVTNDDDLITVGDEYFNNLALRSLFEKDVKISKGHFAQYYRMHDLVYDFAKSFVQKECFTLTTLEDINNAQKFDFSRARHIYLFVEDIDAIPFFIYKTKNVRTLKINGHIPSVSSELFHHLKCLRTLDLCGTWLEELPNEIEKLIHLRWLNLSYTRWLQELPKSVTNLYNLKGLNLHGCINLRKLPEGIERLVNLIDLYFSECRQISYLPEGIGKLTKLRRLSDFIVGGVEGGGCKIGELKNLNFLKGSLDIIGLGRVESGNEARIACLKNKQHLRALYFYFNQNTGTSLVDEDAVDGEGDNTEEEKEEIIDDEGKSEEVVDGEGNTTEEEEEEEEAIGGEDMLSRRMEGVLESLQPHPNLEKLIIRDYLGTVFPNWMVSREDFMSFSNLIFLELGGWRKCKQLPSTLGKLPFLETLVIRQMDKVKFIDIEFFAIDGATSDGRVDTLFPKLKVFQLSAMWNLEEWDMRVQKEDGKEFIFMPCLQYLFLCYCPKLRWFPRHLTQATSLRKLMIWDCPKLTWMPSPSSHLIPSLPIEELILKGYAGSFSKSLLVANNRIFLPKLKLLRVRQSPYSSLPQGLGQLASLEILDIRTCSKIKSIPEGEFQHLTALKELWIIRCPALRRSCQKEIGEDWSKVSHIPKIFIDQKKN